MPLRRRVLSRFAGLWIPFLFVCVCVCVCVFVCVVAVTCVAGQLMIAD